MNRWIWIITALLLTAVLAPACQQQKETPPPTPQAKAPAQPPDLLPPEQGPPARPTMPTKVEKTVTVPETVQGKWESVVLRIDDKTSQTSVEHTVPLNSDYPIPDSKMTIKVGDFLPHFAMNDNAITSVSNEAKNPALKYSVLKDGQEVFSGWLFKNFPEMHPFKDDRFAITLIGHNEKASAE